MRQFGPPFPVKPFCAVMAHSDDELIQTQKLLKPLLGEVESASTPYTVSTFTQYYENEMGTELRKQFLAFRGVKSVADMNQSKFRTADIEDQFRENGNRTINLDPGYLTLDKLVLYTTKNFTHRLYLEHGLFAEITLTYSRTGWRTHSWTYPDFQTPEALTFFTQMRQELYHQLQATGDLPGFKMK